MLSIIIKIVIISSSIACLETKSPVLIDGIDIYDGKRMTIEGVKEPPAPDYRENAKTLKGIDSNNNGMRDDVERWINRRFHGEDKKSKVLRRMGKVIYDYYVYSFEKDLSRRLITKKLDHIIICRAALTSELKYSTFKKAHQLQLNVKALVINTRERLNNLERIDYIMNGIKQELPEKENSLERCK